MNFSCTDAAETQSTKTKLNFKGFPIFSFKFRINERHWR